MNPTNVEKHPTRAKEQLPHNVAVAIEEVLSHLWQAEIEDFVSMEPAPDKPHIFRDIAVIDGWFYGHNATAEELVEDFYPAEAEKVAARRRARSFRDGVK